MVEIKLTNSKTRRKEPFSPIDRANIRMYACGPTVYDRAHLGNARPVVVFDVLFRLLRHVYGAGAVTYARNFTDVDDKINARAEATGRPIREITDETIGWYHDDMDAIGALRPTHEPRATDYIGQMVGMIETLIQDGFAYAAEGHVLFEVRRFDEYGQLSGRSLDDMIAGARVEVAPFKRDPMDFVLWKPSTGDQPGWDSPWGHGRPGWHIECSAMSEALLGETFDIHAGGMDLMFPHHENEIAQSRCAHHGRTMANVWLHNEMLQVEGKKMSKSLGNFFTVRDLLDQGIPGEVIRFVLLSTHYRSPMDWTAEKVGQARAKLRKWAESAAATDEGRIDEEVVAVLCDDLNTSQALTLLGQLCDRKDHAALVGSAALLGFDLRTLAKAGWATQSERTVEDDEGVLPRLEGFSPLVSITGWGDVPPELGSAAAAPARIWLWLRHEKRYQEADMLRGQMAGLGFELKSVKSDLGQKAVIDAHDGCDPAGLDAVFDDWLARINGSA